MEQTVTSPGLFSDDDVVASPVLESTAAGFGDDVCKDLLSEFSAISSDTEGSQQAGAEHNNGKLKVYLRVRPLKSTEVEKGEDQGCVCIENLETLLLKAPKASFTMRNTERGVGQAAHRFSFTQIFGPEVGQKLFFDETMKQMVKDVLNGQNWLVYTYGITNSGKTHTIQGSNKDGGILPRSLAVIFNSVGDRLYQAMDLKPSLSSEVIRLDSRQVRQEETKKQTILRSGLWEEELLTPMKRSHSAESQLRATTSGSFDSGVAGLSSSSQLTNHSNVSQTEESGPCWDDLDRISLANTGDVQFSIWVSFFEIYNELIYDLLEPTLTGQNRKRQTLRLCEDQTGNPYVKDLNWINVQDADEAWKLLKLGRKNQTFASTHMNQTSSRSHSIFSIRILHLQRGGSEMVPKISELSLCDLAGSERCKDQKSGDRMKEANNINTSLHTLGRCIAALRQNQQSKWVSRTPEGVCGEPVLFSHGLTLVSPHRSKQTVVPFRDSKLTRVFQGFFTGRGRSCMIVNINQCASTYDETLHVAKFSAIASQLVQVPPTKLGLPSIQSIIKEHTRRTSQGPEAAPAKEEVESEDDSEDEADVSMYAKEDLLRIVEAARELLVQERQEKLQLEMRLRDEICNEMLEHMREKEQWCSQHVDTQRELLEELYEDKLNNLKESLTDYYQEEIQERDEKIEELQAALQEAKQNLVSLHSKQEELGQGLRRSKRVTSSVLQKELADTKAELEQCQMELNTRTAELRKCRKLLEPPPSAKPITLDVDRKLEDGQKNIRLLRSELQKLGECLQSAERACCHSTGAGKLREALCTCDDILARQDQTLAELQNNMILVKLDLRKKAACIAEQYHTVQKLQAPPTSTLKKRFCANRENVQPNQPPGKRPFLHNLLSRSAPRPVAGRGWQLRSVAL
ncbi:KI20A protein, partial [Semnornis frantzii]|nr:KI20A protein [Semnornis frantzii]